MLLAGLERLLHSLSEDLRGEAAVDALDHARVAVAEHRGDQVRLQAALAARSPPSAPISLSTSSSVNQRVRGR